MSGIMNGINNIQDKLWLGEVFLPPIVSPVVSILNSVVAVVQIVKGIACSIFFGLGSLILYKLASPPGKCSHYFHHAVNNVDETMKGVKNLCFSLANVVTLGIFCYTCRKFKYL